MNAAATDRRLPSLSWFLLCVLAGTLLLAGGASRADVLGQVVVRTVAIALSIVAILWADRPDWRRSRPVWLLLGGAALLALAQLVPLPPGLWQQLPGRAMLARAADLGGFAQPWRPWSMVPGATINAVASLVVPGATLFLVSGLRKRERGWLPALVLCLVGVCAVVGLLQFSGAGLKNPLINDEPTEVSGTFANRNHFALLLALGCVIAPAWAARPGAGARPRALLATGLMLLFALLILATGSRAGIVLGLLALAIGLGLASGAIRREWARLPPRLAAALIGGVAITSIAVVTLSVVAGRAVSIQRALTLDPEQDARRRSLAAVWAMLRHYFPVGYGLGGFDPVFRISEPFHLLTVTYLNLAHDDLLEVALDSGVPGLVLLLAALAWWGWTSVHAWRQGRDGRGVAPRLGAAVLLLILIASLSDYPARTPLIMAMVVIGACWLNEAGRRDQIGATPREAQRVRRPRRPVAWAARGGLAAGACLLAYPPLASSLAYPLRIADPRLARTLAPWDGRITAALAQTGLTPQASAADRARSRALAREALRQDPTAIDALVTLGIDAQLRGDQDRARHTFDYAQSLSRRSLNVQLWFVEDAVRRGDVPGALRNYDIALRTSTVAPTLMFPVLASAVAEAPVRTELVRVLSRGPAWSGAFTDYLASHGQDPRASMALFLRLHQVGVSVSAASQAAVISALVTAGQTGDAWTYYAAIRPGVDRGRSRDPRFAAGLVTPTAFDWNPINVDGVSSSIDRAADGGLFGFSAPPSVGGPLLQQVQLLPAGAYLLRGRSDGIDQPTAVMPYWSLTCHDGRELGRVAVPNSGRGPTPFGGRLVVPADCPLQTLSLIARPSDSAAGLTGQISEARLEPAG